MRSFSQLWKPGLNISTPAFIPSAHRPLKLLTFYLVAWWLSWFSPLCLLHLLWLLKPKKNAPDRGNLKASFNHTFKTNRNESVFGEPTSNIVGYLTLQVARVKVHSTNTRVETITLRTTRCLCVLKKKNVICKAIPRHSNTCIRSTYNCWVENIFVWHFYLRLYWWKWISFSWLSKLLIGLGFCKEKNEAPRNYTTYPMDYRTRYGNGLFSYEKSRKRKRQAERTIEVSYRTLHGCVDPEFCIYLSSSAFSHRILQHFFRAYLIVLHCISSALIDVPKYILCLHARWTWQP